MKERDLRKQSQLIRQSSNQGDEEGALAALENLIAQKEIWNEEPMAEKKEIQLLMFKLRILFAIIKTRYCN